MHNQLLSFTSLYLSLLPTFFPLSLAAPNFDHRVKYPAHHHSRLVNRLNAATANAVARRNGLDSMGAVNEGNRTIDVIKREELVKRDGTKYVFMHHVRSLSLSRIHYILHWAELISPNRSLEVRHISIPASCGVCPWLSSYVLPPLRCLHYCQTHTRTHTRTGKTTSTLFKPKECACHFIPRFSTLPTLTSA